MARIKNKLLRIIVNKPVFITLEVQLKMKMEMESDSSPTSKIFHSPSIALSEICTNFQIAQPKFLFNGFQWYPAAIFSYDNYYCYY